MQMQLNTLLLLFSSTWTEIYFVRFNPLDHATNMMIIDALCSLSYKFLPLWAVAVFFVYIVLL